jgi:hypothetical protein
MVRAAFGSDDDLVTSGIIRVTSGGIRNADVPAGWPGGVPRRRPPPRRRGRPAGQPARRRRSGDYGPMTMVTLRGSFTSADTPRSNTPAYHASLFPAPPLSMR